MTKLILASNSPRRKQILSENNYKFTVIPSEYQESDKFTDPYEMAVNFSFNKAMDVWNRVNDKDSVIIGSDTVVFCDNKILGKPKDRKEAQAMLQYLSGRSHFVISGYCIITKDNVYKGYDKTEVVFNNLSRELVNQYLDSGLYVGKAGSYGIQDGYPLVKTYIGSINNVIGLPSEKIFPILNKCL